MAGEQEELRLDLEELRFDLEELRHLESISEIRNVDAMLSTAATSVGAAEKALAAAAARNYTNLSSFSWDQDNNKIKIYVFLEGVEQEKVESVFKSMSVDVKFHDVQGKNYRCAITKLNKEILPDKCKALVKPNKVIITLFKASKGNWLDLHFKEDKLKPSMDKDKDPMAGIMDLIKNM